jgi:dihydrofolate reductase
MPRKLVYDVAVTLDGYISGPNHDTSAFAMLGDHVDAYFDRLAAYSAVVMGRGTYEAGYSWGLKPGVKAYPHMDHYVFSKTLQLPADSEVNVIRTDAVAFVRDLKSGSGGDIYLCGGGAFAGEMLRSSLIDKLILKLNPIVIGAGVLLFGAQEKSLETISRFRLEATHAYKSGVALLTYAAA